MSWINCAKTGAKWMLVIGLLSNSVAQVANAAVQEITAVFRPDSANPQNNKFENTTPQSGFCPGHIPQRCKDMNIFSIRNSDIVFRSNRPILANHESIREGAMFKVPSYWRQVDVINNTTREVETVEVRIAGVGSRTDIAGVSFGEAWVRGSAGWLYAPAPCQTTGYATGNTRSLLWHWIVPEGAGACAMQAVKDIPQTAHVYLEYSYELRTPNPLGMSAGQYTGSTLYSVGPELDFDFGDVMIPSQSELVFNFTLDVQHTLKVDVPPGGNRIELEPQGGWQAWLTHGRKPTRLFRDQTFNISASSRFKMLLECQYSQDGNNCSLYEPMSRHTVPLNLSVSLPHGLTDAGGQPVTRRPLRRDGSGTELFQPALYVDRKPGTLHFEIPPTEVDEMIRPGQATQYSGSVTVIWDSQV
ncbi:hypothetical protein JFU37_28460 [Pseudomonas sp. TH41]|uniref:hypothetical protein n=1 Tax=Pseudomonas sp. TH41 TaxID=2796405 RepID=UPI0019144EF3|nr:hypothetical protein [Pseudomonas sp. TH41]MBK5356390.1 hypothetical protein [Pseudomonas sp. TH41]